MNATKERGELQDGQGAPTRMKMRMLYQMAEALEDEAAGLCRRASSFELEESSLKREIEEYKTQINRLNLKAGALRLEHQSLMEKADGIRKEACALRQEAASIEEASAHPPDGGDKGRRHSAADIRRQPQGLAFSQEVRHLKPVFFHRRMLLDLPG